MSTALSRERVYLGEVIVMDTDGITVSAGNERASHGAKIGTESVGERKMDVRINPPRPMQNVHVLGWPGTAQPIPLACMCLEDIEFGTGVAVLDRRGGLVAELLDCLDEKTASRAVHLMPTDCDTRGSPWDPLRKCTLGVPRIFRPRQLRPSGGLDEVSLTVLRGDSVLAA